MLSACSAMPSPHSSSDDAADDLRTPLEFFAYASITPAKREALVHELQKLPESEDSAVKLALLQSLPGSSVYDPGTARRRLQAISYSDKREYAALARLRLNEMSQGSGSAQSQAHTVTASEEAQQCRAQVENLQTRLDKIVDIERSLDSYGNGAKPNPPR